MIRGALNKRGFKILLFFASVILWLAVWEIAAAIIDVQTFFPGAIKTLKTFSALIFTSNFWFIVSLSIFRILSGLLLGMFFGILFSFISINVFVLDPFISFGMSIIKSTPVAALIMILWVTLKENVVFLPVIISMMMVTPIIWQNLKDAYGSLDKDLLEVSDIFEFSSIKRFKILILPALMKFFIPAVLTSVGLAWKSGIAAEIIAFTADSIGEYIYTAKTSLEGDVMLAWTLAVIIISLIFEAIVKTLTRRIVKNASDT